MVLMFAMSPDERKGRAVGWAECNEAQQLGASMCWASYLSPTYEISTSIGLLCTPQSAASKLPKSKKARQLNELAGL